MSANLKMLEIAAEGLGDFLPECVFVGGATTILYINSPGAAEPRPTDDVDCVVEITTHSDYRKFEENLRKRGFTHDRRESAPLCRWIYSGVTIDMMPTNEKILGFTNRWYRDAWKHRTHKVLPNGTSISILPLAYFIATKLEAFSSRGQGDARLSSDIEDILYVIDGAANAFREINSAPTRIKKFLRRTFSDLLKDRDFRDAVEIHLAREGEVRIERTRSILTEIAELSFQESIK